MNAAPRRSVVRAAWLLVLVLALGPVAAAAQESAGWRQAAPLPEARTEVSVVAEGGFLYLLGGLGPGAPQPDLPRAVYRYDPQADAWTTIGELPEGLHHAGLAALDGKHYVVGGYAGDWQPSDRLHILDLSTGAWRQGAPLPTPRGALAVAVAGGRLHAVGGEAAKQSLAVHDIYDPAADSWEGAPPLARPRNHHAAAVLDGRLVVTGGRDGRTSQITDTEIYDPAARRWSPAAPMPTGRSGIAATTADGRMLVFGGEAFDGTRRTFAEAEAYDPQADRWTALPPLPTPRHGLGAAVVGGRVHVVSGGPQAGLTFSAANEYLVPAP